MDDDNDDIDDIDCNNKNNNDSNNDINDIDDEYDGHHDADTPTLVLFVQGGEGVESQKLDGLGDRQRVSITYIWRLRLVSP